jgi:beta-mannosidase
MHVRRIIALLILGLFVVIDGLAWLATYWAVTASTPEERQRLAAATPTPATSIVQQRRDNFSERISLNGAWRYRQTGSETSDYFAPDLDVSSWHTMDVPQNWYLVGLNYHGVIWFRREFAADANWRGRMVRLGFDGVDYFADVWLNGQSLGRHTGYFQPFAFDVADRLNYGGDNVLVMRVESPYEEYDTAWPHRKTLIKGAFEQSVVRPGGGWGLAGQEYNTGGIWGDVWLTVSDFITVDTLQLQAQWPTTISLNTSATATVQARVLLRNHADGPVEASVGLTLTPRNFDGDAITLPSQAVTLARGETEVELSGVVHNPRLWWTWDRGAPNLYTARLAVISDGKTLAEKETAFGFRQILVGEDWTWTLNGQRFFPRGSNYISTQWLSQTDKAWFLRDAHLMRDANLNFIRVYAHVEPVEFYEAADELGILVWQDFPLHWGYSDAPAFIDEAQRQMRAMVELLYNHPGIVVWCVHNESPWDTPALANRTSNYDRRQNKRLDELLRDLARDLDPTRYVHVNSGGGDKHVYPGWAYGSWRDFADLPGAPFVTEYGAQALPNLVMMRRMFVPQELTYQSGEVRTRWEFQDFQARESFDTAGVDQGRSTEEFITHSQAYQANLVQFATETYRRAKYNPMQGIFHFMFVDDWPSITWSVLDSDRRPKAGFYALQTAMQPILPSVKAHLPIHLDGRRWVYTSTDKLTIALWVVNDTLNEYPDAQLRWRIDSIPVRSGAGGGYTPTVLSNTVRVNVRADESRYWTSLRNLPLAPGAYRLSLELDDAGGQPLGHNQFEFAIVPEERTR